MLVLNDSFDYLDDGTMALHCIRRYVERCTPKASAVSRAGDILPGPVTRFLRVIEEINHYLPDDWRLTRSKNNFRILIREYDEVYVLAGRSLRLPDEQTLHIVDTVLHPDYVDSIDREGIVAKSDLDYLKGRAKEQAYDEIKLANPEIVRPNLYFLKPLPDDCPSPLFARQYEKVFRSERQREFHRIYPLTKHGIDRQHFRWIEWTINGELRFVKYPACEARGKNYWLMEIAGFEKAASLLQSYKQLLADHGIKENVHSYEFDAYAIEYKLLYSGDPKDRQTLFTQAERVLANAGFVIDNAQPRKQRDIYYDDEQFCLGLGGTSFRLRQTGDTATATLKVQSSQAGHLVQDALCYNRFQEDITLSPEQVKAMLQGRFTGLETQQSLRKMMPRCGSLEVQIIVETERKVVLVRNEDSQQAEICFDFSRFLKPKTKSSGHEKELGRDVEIELESRGIAPAHLAQLTNSLEKELGLIASPKSKYERGLDYLTAPGPK